MLLVLFTGISEVANWVTATHSGEVRLKAGKLN
jgi:hypothetical protein